MSMSEFIKVKASELEGAPLDWAVAKAIKSGAVYIHGGVPVIDVFSEEHGSFLKEDYEPSTDWSEGGPLVEKYNLTLSSPKSSVHRNGGPSHGWGESGVWSACTWEKGVNGKRATGYHESSALTAAMRTIVKFELGDTVEVPKEMVA